MSESTLIDVLSDSQLESELCSNTVHRADVMLFCRCNDPFCASNPCSKFRAREVICRKRAHNFIVVRRGSQTSHKTAKCEQKTNSVYSVEVSTIPLRQHRTVTRYQRSLALAFPAQVQNVPCRYSTHGPGKRRTGLCWRRI